MVDREVFDRRLSRLEGVLRDLRRLAVIDRTTFLSDRGLQAQAERRLYLAAECALDLAHHLISERGWKTPASYREAFQILRSEGVFQRRWPRPWSGGPGFERFSRTCTWTSTMGASTRS